MIVWELCECDYGLIIYVIYIDIFKVIVFRDLYRL